MSEQNEPTLSLRERTYLLPDPQWRLLHGGNVLGSTALFVALWFTVPEWVRVPYAAFWGACILNSLLAWLVRRDMRKRSPSP